MSLSRSGVPTAPADEVAFGEEEPEPRGARRLTREEREAAIRVPGPTWREWLYTEAFRWWLGIALLIGDAWLVAGWIEVGGWVGLAVSLPAALYIEYLLFQYLWHPYHPELRGKFRRTWYRPFKVGRWTADRARLLIRGGEPTPGEVGPDPREFL